MLMTLCIFSCHAQIIQVNDMKEVIDYFNSANSKTLAIFDVDMVLVQPSDPAFQMANMKRFGSVSKRILKDVPAEKQMMFFSLMTISSEPVLIDECTPQFLNSPCQRGIPTIALTANLTGSLGTIKNMEEWRIQNLKLLGIDFTQSAPYQQLLIFTDFRFLPLLTELIFVIRNIQELKRNFLSLFQSNDNLTILLGWLIGRI
jgi:hypothetical protein